jgi:hypothetical protein
MTDDAFKRSRADSDQEEFEHNAVDPVPWVGQEPDGPTRALEVPIPDEAEGSKRSDRNEAPNSDPEVPALGAARKPQR